MQQELQLQRYLDFGLRAYQSYQLSALGWSLSQYLGWQLMGNSQIHIHEVSNAEVNVVIEVDPINKLQWIAVRGSSNLRNWMLNLRYVQRACGQELGGISCGGVDFHRGFLQAAGEVLQLIIPFLNPDFQTRLTGHSLGGAIAAILMVILQESGYSVEQCITFGQPKVTDAYGAEKLKDAPLIRLIHGDDIVPSLPPGTVLTRLQGGYMHFGQEVLINANGSVLTGETSRGFWRNILETVAVRDISELSESVIDHGLHHYLNSILNYLDNHRAEIDTSIRTVFQVQPLPDSATNRSPFSFQSYKTA